MLPNESVSKRAPPGWNPNFALGGGAGISCASTWTASSSEESPLRRRCAAPGGPRLTPMTRRLFGPEINRRTEENVTRVGLEIVEIRREGIWRETVAVRAGSAPEESGLGACTGFVSSLVQSMTVTFTAARCGSALRHLVLGD